jgi:hypothetical protein
MTRAVEWGSPNWGKPGHNVHVAENGSAWAPGEHGHGVIEP